MITSYVCYFTRMKNNGRPDLKISYLKALRDTSDISRL